jgi:hypothetical protein
LTDILVFLSFAAENLTIADDDGAPADPESADAADGDEKKKARGMGNRR